MIDSAKVELEANSDDQPGASSANEGRTLTKPAKEDDKGSLIELYEAEFLGTFCW